jgi:RecA/RadA recombinase
MKIRKVKPTSILETAPRSKRWAELGKVAAGFKSFRPAPSVLTRVRAVPTIFPQFDHRVRVGGLPIERLTLLHGESGGGKTYLSIGLLLSFLLKDHFAALIDAERTTPISWLEKAMGEYSQHPFFFAARPATYEETVGKVRDFVKEVRKARMGGKVKDDTSAIIVLDSIRKLVPKDQWDRIVKESKREAKDDNVRNRGAQIKAQMNAAWLDELIPLLEETQTTMVIIAREMADPDAPPPRTFNGRKAAPATKTGGGAALFYDASLDLRCTRVKQYGKETDGKFVSYGDVHRVDVTKSKVSGRESFRTQCTFNISNGTFVPQGFDRGRDLVELARSLDVIEGTSWLKHGRVKWRSEDVAVKKLTEDPALFERIEAECRALFKGEETREKRV